MFVVEPAVVDSFTAPSSRIRAPSPSSSSSMKCFYQQIEPLDKKAFSHTHTHTDGSRDVCVMESLKV